MENETITELDIEIDNLVDEGIPLSADQRVLKMFILNGILIYAKECHEKMSLAWRASIFGNELFRVERPDVATAMNHVAESVMILERVIGEAK